MTNRSLAAYELLAHAATMSIRILSTEGIGDPEFSSQRLRCRILRTMSPMEPSRWIETLKGKRHLRLVSDEAC